MKFTACCGKLRTEGAPTSFTVCDAYCQASQSRSSIEYLMPTDNIIVLNPYLKLTKTAHLVGML